jgi:outer membrane protein assembly factor BamE (lipoprotein component of BamABCDE complex)
LALICIPVVLAVAAIITAVVFYSTSPRRPTASQADCDRVQVGMTRAQVEHVLGGPPGDYRTRDSFTRNVGLYYVFWDEWKGDGGMILVEFDGNGRVCDKEHFDHFVPRQRSLIDRIMPR